MAEELNLNTIDRIKDELLSSNVSTEEVTQFQKLLPDATREQLREIADAVDYEYPSNLKTEKLKEGLSLFLSALQAENALIDKLTDPATDAEKELNETLAKLTADAANPDGTRQPEDLYKFNPLTRLIRIKLTVKDPALLNRQGDMYIFHNDTCKDIKCWVPYDEQLYREGYHVPLAILYILKNKKYMKRNYNGQTNPSKQSGKAYTIAGMYNSFDITIEPKLTKEELNKLAEAQQIRFNAAA